MEAPLKPKMVLAGGSGFLGQVLARYFVGRGWEVVIMSRREEGGQGEARWVRWDGVTQGDWVGELEGADGVINLAGVSVNCRYTERNRRLILDSRIESTRVLGEAIGGCAKPPRVWLNSSTATIYKHSFDRAMAEDGVIEATAEAKDEFSVEVAQAWEREFFGAKTPGTRKVALRSAMVLGLTRNSVFPVMRRMVRLGLGGTMGHGRQYMSWIHERDFCRAVEWLMEHEELEGVVNIAAPNPVTSREMMRTFREVCGVPMGLPAPGWLLEIGAFFLRTETELIIKSRRAVPGKLVAAGFEFEFPEVELALRELEGRSAG